jgi:hypothetical protein
VNEQTRYQFFKRLESLSKLRELDIGNLLEDHRSRISPFLDPNATISYNFPALEKLSFRDFDDYSEAFVTRVHYPQIFAKKSTAGVRQFGCIY